MALGVRLRQKLEGTYHLLASPGDERPIALDLRIFIEVAALRTRRGSLSGHVHAPGLCEEAPIDGHFVMHLDGRVRYDFTFGSAHRFHGETEWTLLRPKRSLERVFGRIFEADDEIARVLLHTPLEQSLIQLLAGLRPARG
ncbi:MAG: hypothetical protein AAF645_14345 [Myxococcota bacterium]